MSDLSTKEQENVRKAIRVLRVRLATWQALGRALRFDRQLLARVASGKRQVGAGLAIRVARLAAVTIDDVLAGKYPPAGTCQHCGHPVS